MLYHGRAMDADVNCVEEGRNWEDGKREWVEAICYPLSGDQVMWEVSKGGEVIAQIVCVDYPWWRCVREAPEGLLLEFGVRAGSSIRKLAHEARNWGRVIYGFDCWRGLPHSAGGFTKGDCCALRPTDLPDNCELLDGLFSDTLEEFLEAHREPIGFAHLDCDLFSSSYYVLRALMDRFVSGSLIALSDIAFSPDAQRRAWLRYLAETGQAWVLVGKNHMWGEVYRLT